MTLTSSISAQPDLKASVSLTTPFRQYETLSANFRNSGDLVAMTTEADVEFKAGQHVQARQELSFLGLQQLSWRASLSTPFNGKKSLCISPFIILSITFSTNIFLLYSLSLFLYLSFLRDLSRSSLSKDIRIVYA